MSKADRALIDVVSLDLANVLSRKEPPNAAEEKALLMKAVGVFGLAFKDLNRIADSLEKIAGRETVR